MKTASSKTIIVSVINDLVADNRAHKVCTTLTRMGFDVLLTGRKLKRSKKMNKRDYQTRRINLIFNKGPLFYAEYNIRLFLFLLFKNYGLLLANDLDTLPANFIASVIRRKPLIYDSHEYFTEVPELIGRPLVKKTWEQIEKLILPHIVRAYTVCDSIADIYRQKYGTPFRVVRNVPFAGTYSQRQFTEKTNDPKIILYQGALNVGRGLEQVIEAMSFIHNAKLIIAGDGDIKDNLKELVTKKQLQQKVQFLGLLPFEQLAQVTSMADLGLSIEEDRGLNYRFALPNKLFDYIQAKVPVLITNLPEMAAIVKKYDIGFICKSLEPEELAEALQSSLFNEKIRQEWSRNLETAAAELTWENEEKVLREIFKEFL